MGSIGYMMMNVKLDFIELLNKCQLKKGGRKVKILKQGLWSKMDPSGPISLKFCMQGSLVC